MPRKPETKRALSIRRPYAKEDLIYSCKVVGQYGLRNKRELRVIMRELRRYKNKAKELLVEHRLEEKVVGARTFLKNAAKYGLLEEPDYTDLESLNEKLSDVLNLTVEDIADRRLQSVLVSKGISTSYEHSRMLISDGHIGMEGQKLKAPGMLIFSKTEGKIGFLPDSPYVNDTKLGKTKKKLAKKKAEEED